MKRPIQSLLHELRNREKTELRTKFNELFPERALDLVSYTDNPKCDCGKRINTDLIANMAKAQELAVIAWGENVGLTTIDATARKPLVGLPPGHTEVIEPTTEAYRKLLQHLQAENKSYKGLQILTMDNGKWLVVFW